MKFSKSKSKNELTRTLGFSKKDQVCGFTLVEFLVVIGIFIVMMAIMLTRYTSIKSSVSIETLAQDIAISVRKAQLYSVGVKETDSALGKIFPPGYGISFEPVMGAGTSKSYVFFADLGFPNPLVGNKEFDDISNGALCGTSTLDNDLECLDTITITSDDFIKEIYADGSPCTSSLDIVFTRPNLSASIKCGSSSASEAKIEVSSLDNIVKSIIIPKAGNIYVE